MGAPGVACAGSVHTSVYRTLTLGTICRHGGASLAQLTAMRACAMVSPLLCGMKAAGPLAIVCGKAVPAVPPTQAELKAPRRPCDTGFWAPPCGLWQPLQETVSPGMSCSHTPCAGVMARALASRMLTRKATL